MSAEIDDLQADLEQLQLEKTGLGEKLQTLEEELRTCVQADARVRVERRMLRLKKSMADVESEMAEQRREAAAKKLMAAKAAASRQLLAATAAMEAAEAAANKAASEASSATASLPPPTPPRTNQEAVHARTLDTLQQRFEDMELSFDTIMARLQNIDEMLEENQSTIRSVAKILNKGSRPGKPAGAETVVQWLPALVKRYPKFACMQANGDHCDRPLHRELRELIRGYPKLEPGNKGKGYRLNVAHEDDFIEWLLSVLKREKWDAYKHLFEVPIEEEAPKEMSDDSGDEF
ncbi:hypothetical protein HDU78_000761 [Chytriomyces hyalinus]|nr:hypothetical protein HDU78_000761 [Chytriomyces hyalinus]